MSGAQLGSGAMANPDAYTKMSALGMPVIPQPTTGDAYARMAGVAGGGSMSDMFGVPPYNPSAPSAAGLGGGFDLKSPLAGFAMQMAMNKLMPRQANPIAAPQHIMGLQIPRTMVRNPYGYKLGG